MNRMALKAIGGMWLNAPFMTLKFAPQIRHTSSMPASAADGPAAAGGRAEVGAEPGADASGLERTGSGLMLVVTA
jgi:hypothetical protein